MIKIRKGLFAPLVLLFALVLFAAGDLRSPAQAQECEHCEVVEGGGSGDGGGDTGGGDGDLYTCPTKYGCGNFGCRAKSILDPTQICTRYVIEQGASCPSPVACQKAPK